jgi:hypothetical protein
MEGGFGIEPAVHSLQELGEGKENPCLHEMFLLGRRIELHQQLPRFAYCTSKQLHLFNLFT